MTRHGRRKRVIGCGVGALLLWWGSAGAVLAQADAQAAGALELFAQRERMRAYARAGDYLGPRPAPFDARKLQAELYTRWLWARDSGPPLAGPCYRHCPTPYPIYPPPPACPPYGPCW